MLLTFHFTSLQTMTSNSVNEEIKIVENHFDITILKCNSFMKRNMFSLKHDLIFIEKSMPLHKALQFEIHFAEIESCDYKLKFEKVF